MKRKMLVAIAAAAANAAPYALAQAEDPVTLYGRVYGMFDVVEAKGGTAAPLLRRNRVSDQSSLLGVRGAENLGAGLKAFYQLETGFVPERRSRTNRTPRRPCAASERASAAPAPPSA